MNTLKIKFGLIMKSLICFVMPVVALKTIFHFLNFEVVGVGPVITALVAGIFFIIAIILSGVLADFKESEKIPGDLSTSIEALYKDTMLVGKPEVTAGILGHVQELTHIIISNFERKGNWKLSEINNMIDQIDEGIRSFTERDVPIALILKLRNELGNIKRLSYRVEVIKENAFLPAGQVLAEFGVGSVLLVMILLKLEPFYEGMILIGVISLILTSIILLIKDMDNPFEGYAHVDLRQLYKLDKYLGKIGITGISLDDITGSNQESG